MLAALGSNADYAQYRREHGEKAARATELGQAGSYRFKRDSKGWRVFVTTDMAEVPVATDRRHGIIGVDLNADHLAVAETDASGNYLNAWRAPLVTYGKNTHQARGSDRQMRWPRVVEYARKRPASPSSSRSWTSGGRRLCLRASPGRYSRMLSSFSYGKIKAYFLSRGYRLKVLEVNQVNPAYSSVIGRVKFMERYGLTCPPGCGPGAGPSFARLFRAHPPSAGNCPASDNGVHVAFTVPVRKRVKHVWTYWGAVSGQLRPALAAQHRLGKRRRRPNPVQTVVRAGARGVA